MKTSITHITIPDPCTQSWDNMHNVAGGRFCDSCQKTVTDFSNWSNNEILTLLASSKNVCGRFDDGQLVRLNQQLQQEQLPNTSKSLFIKIAAAVIAVFSFNNVKAQVKSKPTTRQHKTVNKTRPKFEPLVNSQLTARKVTGKVVDNQGNPLRGVNVKLLYSDHAVLTDKEGNFLIESSLFSAHDTIVVSADGFVTQNVEANSINAEYKIALAEELKVITCRVGGVSVVRASLAKRVWWTIKKPFQAIF